MRVVLAALVVSSVAVAQSTSPLSPGAVGQGELHAVLRDAQAKQDGPLRFSLKHTDVRIEVSGFLASATVTQVFENPYTSPLEAIYVFPLPEQAAVDAMEIVLGERVIHGVIKTRDDARHTYEKAKAEGKAAALLDQERPNIFTQSVANILPGEEIRVKIHYVERLKYEAGGYQLDFPMTVGPRFIEGAPLPTRQGEGTAPDTTAVADASRITPPVLPPETRSGHDIALEVRLAAGTPIEDVASTSHLVSVGHEAGSTLVTLSKRDSIPNRTFTLKWRTAGNAIRTAVLVHREKDAAEGYLLLMLEPQLEPSNAEVVPRELYFVLDTSGSQSGAPIEKSKAVTKEVLRHLRPDDTFQVLNFDTMVTKFAPAAVRATPENVNRAIDSVGGFWGGGGTDVRVAVREAMVPQNDPARLRMVMFFTDGFIGNDNEVLATLKDNLRPQTRLFGVGVGSDVNRHLVRELGALGRGTSTFVDLRRSEAAVAEEFEARIRGPVLTSLGVELGSLPIDDVYPKSFNDLFEGQPLFLVAKYYGSGTGVVRVRGEVRGQPRTFEVNVTLPEVEPANSALKSLWARQRIQALTEESYGHETPELVTSITETALRYSLMSQYTSFVAVEETRRVGPSETLTTEAVPVELPLGTSYSGVFGELSREEIPPGDPLISVKAPRTARRVTAYFPFGLVKALVYDRVTDAWRGRFLVPATVKDGWYQVQLAVELADGTVARREVRYKLDSKAPDFEVRLDRHAVRAGEKVRLDADGLEPTKELSVYCPLFGEEQLLLETTDQLHFTRTVELPRSAKPGTYELVFVARDTAGNRFEARQKLEVLP